MPPCPSEKVRWWLGTTLGREEGKLIGSGLLRGCSGGKKLAFGLSFVLGGPQCCEFFTTFGGLRFDQNFEFSFGHGCLQ
jgi:hypothetical protein